MSATPQAGRKVVAGATEAHTMQQAEELILNADEQLAMQLNLWKRRNGRFPEQIIYYRDGLSEGELRINEGKKESTFQIEMGLLREATKRVTGNYIPMAGVVCVKNHHVRFFATNPADQNKDEMQNPVPGTVVSQGACHPDHCNFYLISQLAGKGTARPVNYYFMHNDLGIDVSTLEELTYFISCMYSRALTPVGRASPAYMAHHAAERALAYLNADRHLSAAMSSLTQTAREAQQTKEAYRAQQEAQVKAIIQAATRSMSVDIFANLPLQGVQFFC
jgi:eukaryotic translation initiation factor 2C